MRHDLKVLLAQCLNRTGITPWVERRRRVIHLLMFHQVNEQEHPLGLSITPELFEEVVVFLKRKYEIVSLDKAVENLAAGKVTSGCVLTFDDGHRDNYDCAFPILKRHGTPATIFVTADALDTGTFGWQVFDRAVLRTGSASLDLERFGLGIVQLGGRDRSVILGELHRSLKQMPDVRKTEVVNYVINQIGGRQCVNRSMLTWSEAKEMADSGLVTIGAHTITHPILSQTAPAQARREIIGGKSLIEERLGRPVHYFAYPNGTLRDFTEEHRLLVAEAGYRAACTTVAGSCVAGCDLFTLKRIDITEPVCRDGAGRFSPELLSAKLSGLFLRREQ